MNDFQAARADALRRAQENADRSKAAVHGELKRWRLSAKEERFLKAIFTGRIQGRPLLSNLRTRLAAQATLIDGALDWFQRDPVTRRYWVTINIDDWVTWERAPCIDCGAIIDKAQRHIRRAGLEGVGTIETDVWSNLTGEPGRRLVPHVHFLGRAVDPAKFTLRAIESEMQQRRALVNSVGGESVIIKPVVARPADQARVAQYMLKAPVAAKNLVVKPDGWDMFKCEFPRGSAARLLEVLSHLEVHDVLFALGQEGRTIAGAVRRAAREAVLSAPTEAPTPIKVTRTWAAIRCNNGSALLEPCEITPR